MGGRGWSEERGNLLQHSLNPLPRPTPNAEPNGRRPKLIPRAGTMTRTITLLLLLSTSAVADDAVTYSTHIRKVFRDNCNNCHNAGRMRAGLDLSSYAATLKGSSSGEIVIAGDPEESLLYLVMAHEEEPAMPPGRQVKQSVLDQIKTWIAAGLPEKPADIEAAAEKVTAMKAIAANMKSTAAEPSAAVPANPDIVFAGTNGNPVTALAVSPDGQLAAVASQLQIVLFDIAKQEYAGTLAFPEGEIFSLEFTVDGKQLIAGGGTAAETGKVIIWSTETRQRTHVVGDEYDVVLGADISPDASLVLFGGPERILKIADLATGKITSVIKKHTDWVTAASFSPEGLLFTTADRDGNAYVWETKARQQLHTLRGHSGAITSIDWSSDGDHCITAAEDGTVRVWNMHTGAADRQWTAHKDGTLSLRIGSNDQIVTAGRDGFVRRWTMDGSKLAEVKPKTVTTRVAFAGSAIVVGDWSGNASVWSDKSETLVAMNVPAEKLSNDPTVLLASVPGPEAITEIAIAAAEVTSPESGTMNVDTATLQSLPVVSGELGEQLAAAKIALHQISKQLQNGSVSTSASPAALRQALIDAGNIADGIAQPSPEILEARVFLKAALERTEAATTSPGATSVAKVSVASLRDQLSGVNANLAEMAERCQTIELDYTSMDSQISDLTNKSASLKSEYITVAEHLRQLVEVSAALEQQLKSAE